MTLYKYQARNNSGELIQGNLESQSPAGVATYLFQIGLVPIKIEEKAESNSVFDKIKRRIQTRTVAPNDLIVFCRQMHALIKAGVPVVNALTYLVDSSKSSELTIRTKNIISSIESGQTLTKSFAKHVDIFTPVVVSIIDAGENSGQLELAFLRVSEHLEFELNTSRQFKSVMRYPTMVVSAAIIALLVINFMVMPAFAKLFLSFAITLPLPTRVLIALSGFFVNYWVYMLIAIIIAAIAISSYLHTEKGRLFWDKYKLEIPIIGVVFKKIILARFARIFAMMIQAGVPISQGLVLISRVVNNAYFSKGIIYMRQRVERGEAISKTAIGTGFFTPMILQMLKVGEETGSIEYMLFEIAKYYDEDIKYSLTQLAETIEPILLIFMGGMVLVLALGVFLPMWNMVSFIR